MIYVHTLLLAIAFALCCTSVFSTTIGGLKNELQSHEQEAIHALSRRLAEDVDDVDEKSEESEQSPTCKMCMNFVTMAQAKGCKALCDSVAEEYPSLSIQCSLFAALPCEFVLKHITAGNPRETACSLAGFCGTDERCACGRCTEATYGRCLSAPNNCPAGVQPDIKK
eukprot:Awhi_evm1s15786